ncbi:chemotaxis protein CheW [Marinibaculum pumilum]|uniref:Chemotaxis protein CheW n=1 Tax=Marinibaculum pumilum TaxID=1766165 RepID=A0ABV7L0J9_9PROT
MAAARPILPLRIGDLKLALPLDLVERVLPMVELDPLPGAPRHVVGTASVHGRIVPVVDLCQSLGLHGRDRSASDRLVLVRAGARPVALSVEDVEPVLYVAEDALAASDEMPGGLPQFDGMAWTGTGRVLIYDLAACLTAADELRLSAALEARS